MPGKPGDVDCSGIVDVSDAVLLARYTVGDSDIILSDTGLINGDCDGVTGLSSGDVTQIIRIIVGLA